jgi:glycerophosphoryl diester phosphodiesterase
VGTPAAVRAIIAALVAAVLGLVGGPGLALDLQGHRGARGLAPENTLAGFETALAVGVDTLELDVVLSSDDVPMVTHDRRLNPDLVRDRSGAWIGGPGPVVRERPSAALRDYDVGRIRPGSRLEATFPAQRPVDGQRIPTLDEVFERVAALGATQVRFNVETKLSPLAPQESADPERFATVIVQTLRRHGVMARTTVQSFDWRTLQAVQRLEPGLRTAYLSSQRSGFDTIRAADPLGSPWTAGLRWADHGSVAAMVKAAGGAIWSPAAADLDASTVARARGMGLRVVPWTVNEPSQMGTLIDWGVDGLITDRPDLLREVMKARGMSVPTPLTGARR